MGNESSKGGTGLPLLDELVMEANGVAREQFGRVQAIIGINKGQVERPAEVISASPDDPLIMAALANLLLFEHLDTRTRMKIVGQMYQKKVKGGDMLIQQGDVGLAASQLYVVSEGKFEVLERRKDVMFKVNTKARGDCFGEISLMYDCPRSATVAATTDGVVWVLDRETFRHYVQAAAQEGAVEVELFLNSVPLLSSLQREQKVMLVDAFHEEIYTAGASVITEGEIGDRFYIIKQGEAVVMAGGKEVNRLFKADFFGEQALLHDEPRKATVKAVGELVLLALDRKTFVGVLGPLQAIMDQEKSAEATNQRMSKLMPQSSAAERRPTALIVITNPATGGRCEALGHLDEVQELKQGGKKITELPSADDKRLGLVEGDLLGEGGFSRVVKASEETTQRQFAMKRIQKKLAIQCPGHIFCERDITRNMAHPFCIRQYASFQDTFHLYFLFDLMPGGDLMDVLIAEAKVIQCPVDDHGLSVRKGKLARKAPMWKGMDESLARFYVASIVLALEYLQDSDLVFRDLKPENVLVDAQGYAKLADFGFAKTVLPGSRTYTFCGTPGYIAPESILGKGYNQSVDWWTLGVLTYVVLTARQPFATSPDLDQMEVMRRIVNDTFAINYPPYLSDEAKDLISRLLERKPVKRIGMLQGRAKDIKRHPWFKGFDWDALASKSMPPPRKPKADDGVKRRADLTAAHAARPVQPTATQDDLALWAHAFKNF